MAGCMMGDQGVPTFFLAIVTASGAVRTWNAADDGRFEAAGESAQKPLRAEPPDNTGAIDVEKAAETEAIASSATATSAQ